MFKLFTLIKAISSIASAGSIYFIKKALAAALPVLSSEGLALRVSETDLNNNNLLILFKSVSVSFMSILRLGVPSLVRPYIGSEYITRFSTKAAVGLRSPTL